jgi:hypothetical protein
VNRRATNHRATQTYAKKTAAQTHQPTHAALLLRPLAARQPPPLIYKKGAAPLLRPLAGRSCTTPTPPPPWRCGVDTEGSRACSNLAGVKAMSLELKETTAASCKHTPRSETRELVQPKACCVFVLLTIYRNQNKQPAIEATTRAPRATLRHKLRHPPAQSVPRDPLDQDFLRTCARQVLVQDAPKHLGLSTKTNRKQAKNGRKTNPNLSRTRRGLNFNILPLSTSTVYFSLLTPINSRSS